MLPADLDDAVGVLLAELNHVDGVGDRGGGDGQRGMTTMCVCECGGPTTRCTLLLPNPYPSDPLQTRLKPDKEKGGEGGERGCSAIAAVYVRLCWPRKVAGGGAPGGALRLEL